VIYSDAAYILKFYIPEPGSEEVRELFESHDVASSSLAEIEVPSAIHRKWREGLIGKELFQQSMNQFTQDVISGCWSFFPITANLVQHVRQFYLDLPKQIFLRASDALHLVCAKEHGFREIYSNDKHLLAAAKHFGLKGRNVIG
jgi:predicted nucleic acid-binding protein